MINKWLIDYYDGCPPDHNNIYTVGYLSGNKPLIASI